MPIRKVGNKYAIGSGKPIYKTKESAEAAFRGYLWDKYKGGKKGGK
jgi:hypothetical protein